MSFRAQLYDLALTPLVSIAAWPMKLARRRSVDEIPRAFGALKRAGVFPIMNHYYEPMFDTTALKKERKPRRLPGIDFRLEQQTALLQQFGDLDFLRTLPETSGDDTEFYVKNGNFEAGDAEMWFHIIRHFKPRKIIEIGSGHSTKMARVAVAKNVEDDADYRCEHICIEPYEMPWLEGTGATVLRRKLEDVDQTIFDQLEANDILFIDSSHMIRPEGEVLIEYLEVLPRLKKGVIVHVHDIFSPRDYPVAWLEQPRFWNEQYLLEGFLTQNASWEVLVANNMLTHERYADIKAVCPHMTESRDPGSFYLRRI